MIYITVIATNDGYLETEQHKVKAMKSNVKKDPYEVGMTTAKVVFQIGFICFGLFVMKNNIDASANKPSRYEEIQKKSIQCQLETGRVKGCEHSNFY